MGLISFMKDAGNKIFRRDSKEDEAAENAARAAALTDVVAKMGLEVENLNIAMADDTAVVSGTAPSQEVREKVVLLVGNNQGIAQVDDRIEVVTPEPEATFYTVQRGDTLSKIAKTHYGNAMGYPKIFEANRPMLSDPNKIYPGQVLRIPPQQ